MSYMGILISKFDIIIILICVVSPKSDYTYRFYNLAGKRVQPWEFENGNYYVAVGYHDTFKPRRYMQFYDHTSNDSGSISKSIPAVKTGQKNSQQSNQSKGSNNKQNRNKNQKFAPVVNKNSPTKKGSSAQHHQVKPINPPSSVSKNNQQKPFKPLKPSTEVTKFDLVADVAAEENGSIGVSTLIDSAITDKESITDKTEGSSKEAVELDRVESVPGKATGPNEEMPESTRPVGSRLKRIIGSRAVDVGEVGVRFDDKVSEDARRKPIPPGGGRETKSDSSIYEASEAIDEQLARLTDTPPSLDEGDAQTDYISFEEHPFETKSERVLQGVLDYKARSSVQDTQVSTVDMTNNDGDSNDVTSTITMPLQQKDFKRFEKAALKRDQELKLSQASLNKDSLLKTQLYPLGEPAKADSSNIPDIIFEQKSDMPSTSFPELVRIEARPVVIESFRPITSEHQVFGEDDAKIVKQVKPSSEQEMQTIYQAGEETAEVASTKANEVKVNPTNTVDIKHLSKVLTDLTKTFDDTLNKYHQIRNSISIPTANSAPKVIEVTEVKDRNKKPKGQEAETIVIIDEVDTDGQNKDISIWRVSQTKVKDREPSIDTPSESSDTAPAPVVAEQTIIHMQKPEHAQLMRTYALEALTAQHAIEAVEHVQQAKNVMLSEPHFDNIDDEIVVIKDQTKDLISRIEAELENMGPNLNGTQMTK